MASADVTGSAVATAVVMSSAVTSFVVETAVWYDAVVGAALFVVVKADADVETAAVDAKAVVVEQAVGELIAVDVDEITKDKSQIIKI